MNAEDKNQIEKIINPLMEQLTGIQADITRILNNQITNATNILDHSDRIKLLEKKVDKLIFKDKTSKFLRTIIPIIIYIASVVGIGDYCWKLPSPTQMKYEQQQKQQKYDLTAGLAK